jgi:transcriptional regulator with XRE-family HTH domain
MNQGSSQTTLRSASGMLRATLYTHRVPKPPKYPEFSKVEAGRRIRSIRTRRGITQAELAGALGIPQSNVSQMERGVRGLTVHQAVKLARALDVSTDEILLDRQPSRALRAKGASNLPDWLADLDRLPKRARYAVLALIDVLLEQEKQR